MEGDKDDNGMHRITLRIDKELWDRFVEKLPVGISINEKIVTLVRNWIVEYENAISRGRINDKSEE
jgi:hypothetical protein